MLQGITKNGEMKNIRVNDDGSLPMNIEDSEVAINVTQTSDIEVTLYSHVLTVDTTATSISIGKKVTYIMVANYSEEADVSIEVGTDTFDIGANLALEFPMNQEITNLNVSATTADTKIQLVVKGVE